MREYDHEGKGSRIQRIKDRRAMMWRLEEEAYEQEERDKVQAKSSLEIGASDDAFEQHADAVAKKVTGGENAADLVKNQPSLNAAPQGKSEDGALKGTDQLQSSLANSKGGGQQLDSRIQDEMGEKMGADLRGVKIHTDSKANEMSEAIHAKAFTYGQDIYFRQGNYDTSSTQGKELLAHELTHTVQQKSGLQRKIQRFGAEGHESIESYALTRGKSPLQQAEARATYYGNWTRDFNQLLAPGFMTDMIGFDATYALVALMAAVKFGKQPSLAELGIYNPKEHIDNPGAIYPGQDIYQTAPQLKHPSISPKGSAEVSGNTATPQVNINTTESSISGWTESKKEGEKVGAGLLSVDQTGVMSYIRDSNLHVERRLELAVDKGRTDTGLFHFGVALHAIEDLFAHSNFVEIALSKVLEDRSLLANELKGQDRSVYNYMPSVSVTANGKQENRPILTTGTFNPEDAKISLAYEVIAFLETVGQPSLSAGSLAETAFINLLTALSLRSDIKKALGVNIGAAVQEAIGVMTIGKAIEDLITEGDLGNIYRQLKKSAEEMEDAFGDLAKLITGYSIADFFRIFLEMLIRKTLEWLKKMAEELARGSAIETQVRKTPLLEDKKRLEAEEPRQQKKLDDAKQGKNESAEDFEKRKKKLKDEHDYSVKHIDVYNKRNKQKPGKFLLSGPSHSQLAKDHPESIFFGIAFTLAAEADKLLRDKLVVAWKGQKPQIRGLGEVLKSTFDIGKPDQMGMDVTEKFGSTKKDSYDMEKSRKEKLLTLNIGITALRLKKNKAYEPVIKKFTECKDELTKLDLFNYEAREKLYVKFTVAIAALESLGSLALPVLKAPFVLVAAFVAPAVPQEQKDNISGVNSQEIVRSTIDQPKLDQKAPAVKDLLEMSRTILGHPNDSTWWQQIVKDYIKKFPKEIATEIKLRNAGYVDKDQAKGK